MAGKPGALTPCLSVSSSFRQERRDAFPAAVWGLSETVFGNRRAQRLAVSGAQQQMAAVTAVKVWEPLDLGSRSPQGLPSGGVHGAGSEGSPGRAVGSGGWACAEAPAGACGSPQRPRLRPGTGSLGVSGKRSRAAKWAVCLRRPRVWVCPRQCHSDLRFAETVQSHQRLSCREVNAVVFTSDPN